MSTAFSVETQGHRDSCVKGVVYSQRIRMSLSLILMQPMYCNQYVCILLLKPMGCTSATNNDRGSGGTTDSFSVVLALFYARAVLDFGATK